MPLAAHDYVHVQVHDHVYVQEGLVFFYTAS